MGRCRKSGETTIVRLIRYCNSYRTSIRTTERLGAEKFRSKSTHFFKVVQLSYTYKRPFFQDFGDGGAFPEIIVAQYPLNMGRPNYKSTSNALAVQLDHEGKVKYDVIARQGHHKDKVYLL